MASKRRNQRQAVQAQGRRSRFELEVEQILPEGTTYETKSYKWFEKAPRAVCHECGGKEVYSPRKYTPDFFLPNGIILEAKGIFTAKDRKIVLGVRELHPELDIRFVLYYDNWMTKAHKTRYSDWLNKEGILWTTRATMVDTLKQWLTEDMV